MAYITREDGEHFVIPSYRDVLSARSKSILKKDIQLLSQNYGEYITMQKQTATQYEVAFSPDPGYLLGETVWYHFKKPPDMIFCETIPNTTEAILVIVKGGSVYLDGNFPFENISEELVIFLTQQNNFEIYVYGDVPLSQYPEEGKFSFDASAVKSFTVLDEPAFPQLPLLKNYQLQLVDIVLREQGIGVFPLKQLLSVILLAGIIWMGYSYMSSHKVRLPVKKPVNPYEGYYAGLESPDPTDTIHDLLYRLQLLYTMPGWIATSLEFANNNITVSVKSNGGSIQDLQTWCQSRGITLNLQPSGITLSMALVLPRRSIPVTIYTLKDVIIHFVDNLAHVYPGNHLTLGNFTQNGVYQTVLLTLDYSNLSPMAISLIALQFKNLPFVLQKMTINVDNGSLSGSINMEALGS